MSESKFSEALLQEVLKNHSNDHLDNYDTVQRGPQPLEEHRFKAYAKRTKELIKDILRPYKYILKFLKTIITTETNLLLGKIRTSISVKNFYLPQIKNHLNANYLYERLGDEKSKKLLLSLLAYRVQGFKKVKLERNNAQYWQDIKDFQKLVINEKPGIKIQFMDLTLRAFNLNSIGFNLKSYATPEGASCTFVQKQYEFHCGNISCKAEEGDIAIDAGACWGETTLYFAHEVGDKGKVYSFEFIPSNLKVMDENIKQNDYLKNRIELVKSPIWSTSGNRLYYVDWGPGSNVSAKKINDLYIECFTISIDDLVKERNIPRIDFIKMDIEGAELDALKGAEKAIKAFRPKLAISVYHKLDDFETIPKYIDSLNLNYDFHIDHHTIYSGETVLFCIPKKM